MAFLTVSMARPRKSALLILAPEGGYSRWWGWKAVVVCVCAVGWRRGAVGAVGAVGEAAWNRVELQRRAVYVAVSRGVQTGKNRTARSSGEWRVNRERQRAGLGACFSPAIHLVAMAKQASPALALTRFGPLRHISRAPKHRETFLKPLLSITKAMAEVQKKLQNLSDSYQALQGGEHLRTFQETPLIGEQSSPPP